MQIKNNALENCKNSVKDEENQIQCSEKKHKLIKKRKLPQTKLFLNVDLKHVVNVGDICFVYEQALRCPNKSEQTLLKSLYHYKMVSKVTLNNSFVNIQLKKNNENLLPPEYFIQRLRSFGDQQMANMASHLESIHNQFSIIRKACPVKEKQFSRQNQEILLNNFLTQRQGKKYFLFFSEISPQKITMKNIIFSVPLLQALGCNVQNIGLDFLKYRRVFFQVFTAKNYGNFLEGCFEGFSKIQSNLMQNPQMSQEERKQLTQMIYNDEVILINQNQEDMNQVTCPVKVLWFSPHPSICYLEILDFNQKQISSVSKKRKLNEEYQPNDQSLEFLKKVGFDEALIQLKTR